MKALYLSGLFVLFTLIFFANCSSGKKSQATPKAESAAAATDSSFGNITFTPQQFAGMKLFMSHCNRCHPAGKKGKGPSLIEKKPSEFTIHWQVRLGFGPMPSFKKSEISKEELKQIISFVRLIEEKG